MTAKNHETINHKAQSRICLPPLLIVLMLGCGQPHAHGASEVDELASKPSFPPTSQEIQAVTAPGYKTPAGMLQECLGRLVFDLPAPVEWPTFLGLDGVAAGNLAFSEGVRPGGGEMVFGSVNMVKVFGPIDATLLATIHDDHTPQGSISRLEELIKDAAKEVAMLKQQSKPAPNTKYKLEQWDFRIKDWTKSIKEKKAKYAAFDSGLPNSEGYAHDTSFGSNDAEVYSVLQAHLIRDKYIFIFESTQELSAKVDRQQHKRQFVTMLSNFRPRKPNEIPTQPGVCIPHGFIADDGTTATEMHQTLRFADAPGVLYAIHTGKVHGRRLKAPLVTAMATAGIGKFATDDEETQQFVAERIGPRKVRMGGLQASQGGVAFVVRRPGKEPFEAYNVFTGYSGWLGTDVLPFILTEMSTRTMEQAADLKVNPPPFKQSMGRLDALLKSIRLRPTDPLMPELAKFQTK